ncbi:BnaCnng30230D [Brassica napus]|uniref:BnaCnng30230D protein n=1 Tax=Brassica napus TaxID=3708 RepID=A0A078J083_BRANA|nr:BnaCnng30230D [Brassica napus]
MEQDASLITQCHVLHLFQLL